LARGAARRHGSGADDTGNDPWRQSRNKPGVEKAFQGDRNDSSVRSQRSASGPFFGTRLDLHAVYRATSAIGRFGNRSWIAYCALTGFYPASVRATVMA